MKVALRAFFCLTLLFSTLLSKGQARLKLAASGRLTVGAGFISLENSGTERWSAGIGPLLTLEPSLKARWKNNFSVALGGGINLYNFNFASGNYNYAITYFGFKTEGNITKYIYLNKKGIDYLAIGLGMGYSYRSNDQLTKESSGYKVTTTSHAMRPLFYSPQIGTFKREDRFSYSMMVQFTKFLTDEPFIYFDLSSKNTLAKGKHLGNYIGLNIIIDYDLKKKPKPPSLEWKKALPTDHYSREKKSFGELMCNRHKATVWVWDHGMIDGDTISLTINNEVVLSNYKITHEKKKVKVRLKSGANQLQMIAHNEGTVKPNSAGVEIRCGLKKKSFVLNSTLNETAVINLEYLYVE